MNIPSLTTVLQAFKKVIERFPLALTATTVATATLLYIINIQDDASTWTLNLLLTLSLAGPIYVAARLLHEANSLKRHTHWILQCIIMIFLVLYFSLLPNMESASNLFYIRHAMWTTGFILVITFIPFISITPKHVITRFWEYNQRLIRTLILTGAWMVGLMIGISLALSAIDFLFEIRIDETIYESLWVIIAGIFAPLFFLSRLPKTPHNLTITNTYPKEVRLFAQYALVPLVTVYFVILYAYSAKIILSSDWPEGQLAWIILGFSFVGILTYVTLYPLRASESWTRYYGTLLFAAMIPQTAMLFWALSFRLREYGFTENRYFVLLFGIWLLVMAIYYLASKRKDIRYIPITLFFLAVFTSFGPWGAFNIAERSQVHRLERILHENQLLEDETYQPPSEPISLTDEVQINEIIQYLTQYHTLDSIESWFGNEDLDALEDNRWELRETVIEERFQLEIRHAYEAHLDDPQREIRSSGYMSLYSEPFTENVVPIDDFQHITAIVLTSIDPTDTFTISETTYTATLENQTRTIEVSTSAGEAFKFDLNPLMTLGKIAGASELTLNDARIESTTGRATLIIRNTHGQWEHNQEIIIDYILGYLLLR